MNNGKIDQVFTSQVIAIARAAGVAILEIYRAADTGVIEIKSDGSPVTQADMAAHRIIVTALQLLLPIPIISEESEVPDVTERHQWAQHWLIDPLDGTKEFIAGNGEFTVNIALLQQGVPLLGVVHVPVSDETYLGIDQAIAADGRSRAEKYLAATKITDLRSRKAGARFAAGQSLEVLVSQRHTGRETEALLQHIQQHWPVPLAYLKVGSSLKFCWIAEGRADFYPRLGPTSEWDTAAAQAVLVAAGGVVLNAEDCRSLTYNRAQSLLNPWFFAMADAELAALIPLS